MTVLWIFLAPVVHWQYVFNPHVVSVIAVWKQGNAHTGIFEICAAARPLRATSVVSVRTFILAVRDDVCAT
jgi:hypothetical protein